MKIAEFNATQEEVAAYIAEACGTFPELSPLDATLKLALYEARKAVEAIQPLQARKAGSRENRDNR